MSNKLNFSTISRPIPISPITYPNRFTNEKKEPPQNDYVKKFSLFEDTNNRKYPLEIQPKSYKKISEKYAHLYPSVNPKCTKWGEFTAPNYLPIKQGESKQNAEEQDETGYDVGYDPTYNTKFSICQEGPYAGRRAEFFDRCVGNPRDLDDKDRLFNQTERLVFENYMNPQYDGRICSKWDKYHKTRTNIGKYMVRCEEPSDMNGKYGIFRDKCETNELSDADKMEFKTWVKTRKQVKEDILKNPYNNLTNKKSNYTYGGINNRTKTRKTKRDYKSKKLKRRHNKKSKSRK
jgi:hypothetical protein